MDASQMTRPGFANLLVATALGFIIAASPVTVRRSLSLGASVACADDGKHKDHQDKHDDGGDAQGGDDGDDGNGSTGSGANHTATETGGLGDAAATGIAENHAAERRSAPAGSPAAVMTEYEQAAMAATQADEAVARATASIHSTEMRAAAAETAVRGKRSKFDAARMTGDQTAIKAAKTAYDAARAERKAATAALAGARHKLSVAQANAKVAHATLASTVDSASNKDFTDTIADAIDSFFGLKGGS
jgi:hypothetical protein